MIEDQIIGYRTRRWFESQFCETPLLRENCRNAAYVNDVESDHVTEFRRLRGDY